MEGYLPGEEAGPGGGADGGLAVGVGEGHPLPHQAVEGGRADVGVAQGPDGVPALLVGAVPQDVGRLPVLAHATSGTRRGQAAHGPGALCCAPGASPWRRLRRGGAGAGGGERGRRQRRQRMVHGQPRGRRPMGARTLGARPLSRRSLITSLAAPGLLGAAALAGCAPAGEPQAPAAAARRDVTLEWLAQANATEERIFRQIATEYETASAPHKVAFINPGDTELAGQAGDAGRRRAPRRTWCGTARSGSPGWSARASTAPWTPTWRSCPGRTWPTSSPASWSSTSGRASSTASRPASP